MFSMVGMLLYILLCLCRYGDAIHNMTRGSPILAVFPPHPHDLHFNHLVVNPINKMVYVAAVNHLYQLSADLQMIEHVETGPKIDSPYCHARGCSVDVTKESINNHNKILVADPESRILIACGSVIQGACEKYMLSNISLPHEFIAQSIAANDEKSSTFAFIGPERYSRWSQSQVLYVGTTFTNNGDYRHDVPAISSRNLDDLEYKENSFSKQSFLTIDVKYRDQFLVNYIYGFNHSDFIYFVTVQRYSHLHGHQETGYVSKISRSCVSDPNFQTYTEVILQCKDSEGVDYNLIQDAYLMTAGSDLESELGYENGEKLLVGVFALSSKHFSHPVRKSAVCMYRIQDIDMKISENVGMCLSGNIKYRGMDYISGANNNGECPTSMVREAFSYST